MNLTAYIRQRRNEKGLALMTHIVLGYPSFEASYDLVGAMVDAGVDLMELQIPFSEPIADGPVILRANQEALASGATVDRCLAFARRVAADFPIPFVFMTYYNVWFKRGVAAFARSTVQCGLHGAIVPDLPPEEGTEYLGAMAVHGLHPILLFAPPSSDQRMAYLARHAGGFFYCVATKGVTGASWTAAVLPASGIFSAGCADEALRRPFSATSKLDRQPPKTGGASSAAGR